MTVKMTTPLLLINSVYKEVREKYPAHSEKSIIINSNLCGACCGAMSSDTLGGVHYFPYADKIVIYCTCGYCEKLIMSRSQDFQQLKYIEIEKNFIRNIGIFYRHDYNLM